MTADGQKTQAEYDSTPEGRAQLWTKEFAAAKEWMRSWREDSAEKVLAAFTDERKGDDDETHLCFYWASVKMLLALLYGRTPRVSVTRRHGDQGDELGRVSALILERLLNSDIERYDDGYRDALASTLFDFLVPGFGNSRVRYWAEFQEQEKPALGKPGSKRYAPAVKVKRKLNEEACTDYVYWKDQLWSPCRVEADKRWHSFMAPMSREELHSRFDAVLTPEVVDALPLNGRLFKGDGAENKQEGPDPWARAEVWEIWDKQRREVVWFIEGYPRVLDVRPDFLKLQGFWPFPRPLYANLTTSKLLPRSDYSMAQDLYKDINLTATRITELEDAVRVVGVYDGGFKGLSRILDENVRNELVPVQNYAAIAEKGGLDRVISWLPLEQVVAALDKLREQLGEKQRLLYEITGWFDLMRGQMEDPQQLATNTRAIVRFGSARVQSVQDEFARYASDLQRLRAEVVVRFFDDETILTRSNILKTPDAELARQAVAMLRQDFAWYAIEVKPEAIALSDFAAMKAERTEFLDTFARLMDSGSRMAQSVGPAAAVVMPAVLEVVKWTMAGYRGSSSIEGVMDKLLAQLQNAAQQSAAMPQQPQVDPKAQQQAAKTQGDMQRIAAKAQADQAQTALEVQADRARQEQQMEFNVREEAAKQAIKTAGDVKRAGMRMRTRGQGGMS